LPVRAARAGSVAGLGCWATVAAVVGGAAALPAVTVGPWAGGFLVGDGALAVLGLVVRLTTVEVAGPVASPGCSASGCRRPWWGRPAIAGNGGAGGGGGILFGDGGIGGTAGTVWPLGVTAESCSAGIVFGSGGAGGAGAQFFACHRPRRAGVPAATGRHCSAMAASRKPAEPV